MAPVENGRMTHEHDGPIGVVPHRDAFQPAAPAGPVGPGLPGDAADAGRLYRNKAAAGRGEAEDLGFLGARTLMGGKGVTVVQYWRSVEDVYRYASAPDHEHRPAWTAFNARARKAAGAVGIWHETYAVAGRRPRERLRRDAGHGYRRGDASVPVAQPEALRPAAQRDRRCDGLRCSVDDDLVAEVDLAEQRGDPAESRTLTHPWEAPYSRGPRSPTSSARPGRR